MEPIYKWSADHSAVAGAHCDVIDRMTAGELLAFIASTSGSGRLRGLLAYAREVQTSRGHFTAS